MLQINPLPLIQRHTCDRWLPKLGVLAAVMLVAGCASSVSVDDPIAELSTPSSFPVRQIAAMNMLDEQPSEAYLAQLHRVIWVPGYTVEVREEALNRLERLDPDGLHRTIRQQLPRMTMWGWLTRLSEIIGERGWRELSPALVSSWARPSAFVRDETERPEYKALAVLHGEDDLGEVIFDMFVASNSVAEQGLRTRCWQLLHRLGYRDRLITLVAETDPPEDDAMLIDLHAGARDLGIVPHNREEILWLRELRRPERSEFWSQAVVAVEAMSDERRAQLELRDISIAIAAYLHAPELLRRNNGQLYGQLESYLSGQRHHDARTGRMGLQSSRRERLRAFRDELTWGDLAAMLLAVRAFEVPEMVDHLFDYADRDMRDESTEYGGVVNLDEQGRFELLEFPPVIRHHGNKFIAPQAMFDAGYTGLFHFHNHAQRYRNAEHASPGLGDRQYADNTRANCLVFTFIDENTLNMDYYRHGDVVVDMGVIKRNQP